jgi:tetratricopeptide (TPR) repeat protein
MADIFVSYTKMDRNRAFWLGNELRGLGHTPHVHDKEIKAGDDILTWMRKHFDAADHALCVISDEYLNAPFSRREFNAALWRTMNKDARFALLVTVEPCTLPGLVEDIHRCELFGISEEEKQSRFQEFMRKCARLSNVPVRAPKHFLGRDDAISAIDAALASHRGCVTVVALHGLRGVGKTTIAAAYAERHRGDYRIIWWVRAQSKHTIRTDLAALGVRLDLVPAGAEEESALTAVLEHLQHEDDVLLIFDNADDLEALKLYVPSSGSAQVLITSTNHALRSVADELLEVSPWSPETGADYLIKRAGQKEEREAALALSAALEGLPLALEQAGAYCERLEVSFADYQERLEAKPVTYLDDPRYAPSDYYERRTVAKAFELALEEAAKVHFAAKPLMVHAALLAPEPIPLFLFAEAHEKFGEPLASALVDDGLQEAVAALRAFGLIQRKTIIDDREPTMKTDCIRVHRLVRQVVAIRCERQASERGARDQVQLALMEAVASVYPPVVWGEPKGWPRIRRLDAIALALVKDEEPVLGRKAELVATICDRLATYRHCALAMYDAAQCLYEKALRIRETVFGTEHAETAASMNILGVLLHERGNFAAATSHYKRALEVRERVCGLDKGPTATTLNNYAMLLQERGCLEEAIQYCERALRIREALFGFENKSTATSLHNLAVLLLEQDDLEGAASNFNRALEIRQKLLGTDHPFTATTLSKLGIVRCEQGKMDEARRLCEQAKAIFENFFGESHPSTAVALENLARVYEVEGELEQALEFLQRAVNIQKALRPDHPNTNNAIAKLASVKLISKPSSGLVSKPGEALELSKAALVAQEKMFGSDHQWVRRSARIVVQALDTLRHIAETKGDAEDAVKLATEAKEICNKFGIEGVFPTLNPTSDREVRRRTTQPARPTPPLPSRSSPRYTTRRRRAQ